MDCALDLMRRLPPQQIEKNLSDLIDLVPILCEDLLSSVDQPLKIAKDKDSGQDYLLCDYNRDGDSYRWNVDKSTLSFFYFAAFL
jgi:capping protein beta